MQSNKNTCHVYINTPENISTSGYGKSQKKIICIISLFPVLQITSVLIGLVIILPTFYFLYVPISTYKSTYNNTDLVFLIQQFQLIVDQAVLSALLFPQRPLFLQLRAPERLYAVHAGAQLLIGQFQLLFKIPKLPLEVGVLRLEFAKEERWWIAAVVVIFGRGRRGVGSVVVSFEGLVAERARTSAVVSARRGRPPPLVRSRGRLVVAGQVGAPSRGAPIHLGQAAARARAPLLPLPAPLLPARRPLIVPPVLA